VASYMAKLENSDPAFVFLNHAEYGDVQRLTYEYSEQTGNVLETEYYMMQDGQEAMVHIEQPSLKERHCAEYGYYYALQIGKEKLGWDLFSIKYLHGSGIWGFPVVLPKNMDHMEECLIDGNPDCNLDKYVEGTLDIASLVLSPVGLDAIPDAIGVIYFSARGDPVKTSLYCTALMAPMVCSPLIKKGWQGLQYVSKALAKTNKNLIDIGGTVIKGYKGSLTAEAKAFLTSKEAANFIYDGAEIGNIQFVSKGEKLAVGIMDEGGVLHLLKYTDNATKELGGEITDESCRKWVERELKNGIKEFAQKILKYRPSWKPERKLVGNYDKPVGAVGKFRTELPDGTFIQDTKQILEELDYPDQDLTNFKTLSKDGFILLKLPREAYAHVKDFWEEVNKPWLEYLTQNKHDIVVLSDRNNEYLYYRTTKDNFNKIKIELDDNNKKVKSIFALELEYMDEMVKKGLYEYDELTATYKAI
jgi:hypothetical protein